VAAEFADRNREVSSGVQLEEAALLAMQNGLLRALET
jgi:hypothetical protein